MNGIVWRCDGRRADSLGTLGATEAEANAERLKRYRWAAVQDGDDYLRRVALGLKVKARARHAGMTTALAYTTTVGSVIASEVQAGKHRKKPRVRIQAKTEALGAAFKRVSEALASHNHASFVIPDLRHD